MPESDGELLVREDDSPISQEPDPITSTFIKGGAPNQIFMFDRFGLKYGTDDKGHAASIILSVLLLFLLGGLFILGAIVDRPWFPDAIKILGTTFTFVAGVGVGKSLGDK